MIQLELSAAAVLLLGYGLLLLGMFAAAVLRGLVWRRKTRATAILHPAIREALADYLAGNNDMVIFRRCLNTSRPDVADGILSFQDTVNGSARDRLCELALDLGLVHDWCDHSKSSHVIERRTAFGRLAFVSHFEPCRRVAGDLLVRALEDPDGEVRFSASRAVVQGGGSRAIQRVFDLAISQNLLTRIVLAEDLRRHAVSLCEKAVPEALRSEDPRRVLAVLDILVAWERVIPLQDLSQLLNHREREIRLLALRLTPMVSVANATRSSVVRALGDDDTEIRAAAAEAAGRLRLTEALPELALCLRRGSPDLARKAADALAEIPPRGLQTLEELSASANPVTAAAAKGTLDRVRREARV